MSHESLVGSSIRRHLAKRLLGLGETCVPPAQPLAYGLQERLRDCNSGWLQQRLLAEPPTELRADGDLELSDDAVHGFRVPGCEACGLGILKPHVTFFGGSVPVAVSERARSMVEQADRLLVIGSSMQVYSAFRLARQAAQASIPIAILNVGATRVDDLATLHVHCDAALTLPLVVKRVMQGVKSCQ